MIEAQEEFNKKMAIHKKFCNDEHHHKKMVWVDPDENDGKEEEFNLSNRKKKYQKRRFRGTGQVGLSKDLRKKDGSTSNSPQRIKRQTRNRRYNS